MGFSADLNEPRFCPNHLVLNTPLRGVVIRHAIHIIVACIALWYPFFGLLQHE
jgi:hypothetical protein